MTDREQTIRERAYAIWEAGDRNEGSHLDHWGQAEREYDEAEREKVSRKAGEQIIEADGKPADAGPDVRPPSMASPD